MSIGAFIGFAAVFFLCGTVVGGQVVNLIHVRAGRKNSHEQDR